MKFPSKGLVAVILTVMVTLTDLPVSQALPSADATLQALNTWSNGTLSTISPAFAAGTTAYASTASSSTTSATVQPAATDQANATIQVRINGGSYASIASWGSATFNINVGVNRIDTLVTAQDGVTTILYSIDITRTAPLSSDATLSALTISSGTLSPTFAGGTIEYTTSTAQSSVTVTPTTNQANATIQVKVNSGSFVTVASGSVSASLALNVGAFNYIYIQVTAQDGSTVITYTITTTRLSTDSTLQSLTIAWPGVLSPTFASGITLYTASVSSSTSSITVTPAATDQTSATIQLRINNGTYVSIASWAASSSLSLNTGANPIDIKVTAQDGQTVSTYTITVNRASPPSTDATLSSLSISSGSLSPTFVSGTQTYISSTTAATLKVTPTSNQSNATIQIQINNGGYSATSSATESLSLTLVLGANVVDVKITAQDSSTILTYSVTVTRLATDSTLQALNTWSSGSLTTISPSFAAGTSSYSENASTSTTSITVQAAVSQSNATIQLRINGGSYVSVTSWGSSTLNLNFGDNTIDILVTAQDGTSTSTYTIVVTKTSLAPTGINALAGDSSAAVSWSASAGATSYTAMSSPGNLTCTTSATTCTVRGLTNGINYSFTVAASNNAGTSSSSSSTGAVTPAITLLPPTNIGAASGNAFATVSWTTSTGATSYTVTSSPGGFTCTRSSSPCTVTGLTNGTSYSFTVTATDGITTTTASSASNSVQPLAPLLAPTSINANAGDTSATISWNSSADATFYTATSSPGNFKCTTSGTICVISGLENETAYTFTVTATNGISTSPSSIPSSSATPVAPTPPPPPLPPFASMETPVTALVNSNSKDMSSLSATLETNGSTPLIVTISIPAGAISDSAHFALAPSGLTSNSNVGIVSIRITATTSSGESITHFDRALILNIGYVSRDAFPVFSQSGLAWTSIPLVLGPKLSKDMQEGYYIASDGSMIILTRHLTYFGVKKMQRMLFLSSKSRSLRVGKHARIFIAGGSGRGVKSFAVTNTAVCTVTKGGYLRAISAGLCTVTAVKDSDDTYLKIDSLPITLAISE